MKEIWRWINAQVQEDFNAQHYAFIATFLAASITLNYQLEVENNYLALFGGWKSVAGFFTLYAIAYTAAITSFAVCYRRMDLFRRQTFWIKSILILIVLSLDHGTFVLKPLANRVVVSEIRVFLLRVTANLSGIFIAFVPLFIYYVTQEKNDRHAYGLRPRTFDAKPYLAIMAIMVPIILAASFSENFQHDYPMYPITAAYTHLNIPAWLTVIIFELSYAFDLVTVEFIFRGFLILGMIHLLGRNAILTMAVLYCFLHFGKPPIEAISSIFGGYVLGVVAYETKSIWGCVLIHVGVAWTMELASYLQKNVM